MLKGRRKSSGGCITIVGCRSDIVETHYAEELGYELNFVEGEPSPTVGHAGVHIDFQYAPITQAQAQQAQLLQQQVQGDAAAIAAIQQQYLQQQHQPQLRVISSAVVQQLRAQGLSVSGIRLISKGGIVFKDG